MLKMSSLTRAAALFVAFLLLVGATGSASSESPPSGSISFIPNPQGRHETSRGDGDGIETFYGQLARRHHRRRSGSERPATADVRLNQSPANATSGMVLFARAGEPGEDTYGKLVHVPGCFVCPPEDIAKLQGRQLLESLTTQRMKSFMRARSGDLHNKCVFYTASIRKPAVPYLSEAASIWACSHNKYSIWHLWPNKVMAEDSPNRYQDFYGLYERDNWLNSIDSIPHTRSRVPPPIEYFENMSEAMAQSCTGEVVIMSMSTNSMEDYISGAPNIWRNKERPALRALKNAGKVTRFLVVDYDPPQRVYEFDIETNQRGHVIPDSELQSRGLAGLEGLQKRAVDCSANGLAQIPPKGDPFADDYDLF